MYKGLIELPECSLCLEIMLNDLSMLLPCRHILHSQCAEPLSRTKQKCPLCNTKIKEAKQMYFNGEEHENLEKKELIPQCVAQKFQQYEAQIQMLQHDKEELEKQQLLMKKEIEQLRKVNNTGIIEIVKALEENENKVQQFQQTIEELKRKSKDKAMKNQSSSVQQPLRNNNTRVGSRIAQSNQPEKHYLRHTNLSKEQKEK